MNQHLQDISNRLQKLNGIDESELKAISESLKNADKALTIAEFKLQRTEKVKRTTSILLEETIEELEQKRKVVEESRAELQQSLEDLEAAKDQLVQQEKLASLGQLTAGIAHEIKNPLNFVNNFSEVSIELIEEVKNELSAFSDQLPAPQQSGSRESPFEIKENGKANQADGPGYIIEILNDIELNLKKIYEHGTRADSIVKSMLQHSRGGTGQKEPTDLNALINEYVNLSFHGMRAGKNPLNVDIQLELDEQLGKISIISEDFSRIILNLCNNAFDAMRQKLNSKDLQDFETLGGLKSYKPKLTLKTYRKNKNIFIEIEDNGPGIPDEIKDKILQPFFTTKKGTEGTGLGLSITNDIVKAHGGQLEVSSNKDRTRFIIQLPQAIKL